MMIDHGIIPSTVSDLHRFYCVLRSAGDGDEEGHLAEWLEEQMLVTRARDMAELAVKVDVLFGWISPGMEGLTEKGTDLLLRQVNSLRTDLRRLTLTG
ncbi:hypothetical protein [Thalassospira sp. MCCC 1A01428]|uniref:hypothetical protein n=1 Tax=Thalassospira sp. MCCC 1A01428 TaxID=1470575 RepID=UPI000A1D8F90|nr:hypothetical protein [Thalassospira sp. MCCC 1A01428]OSQ34367.1 hypothetical protein THS27_25520 [Thalassospira sp. MCCC 1A01428]